MKSRFHISSFILLLTLVSCLSIIPAEEFGYNYLTQEDTLKNLNDVNITNPAGQQVIVYNQTSNRWYNSYLNDSAHHVNASDYWTTGDRGSLRNVEDIEHSWLDTVSLLWSNAGHIMDTFLDMKNNSITDILSTQYNISGCSDTTPGTFCYDSTYDTMRFVTDSGQILQMNQETTMPAKNIEGSTVPDGSIVYIMGATGANTNFKLAKADNLSTSGLVGVVTKECINNQVCPVVFFALVHEFDTSSYTAGDHLYLSDIEQGNFTTTPPEFPNIPIWIATVIRVHATEGTIFVFPRLDSSNGITVNSLGLIGDIIQTDYKISSLPGHENLNGKNIFAILMNGTTGIEVPHIGFQSGGEGQANFFTRSGIVVPENLVCLNNTNRTDAQCWADAGGFNWELNDFNTTNTDGADWGITGELEVIKDTYVHGNVTIEGQQNISGNTIIQDRLFVGLDPSEGQSIINPGDVAIGGNLILASGTIAVLPDKYGLSAGFFNNGADEANNTIFYLNFSGTLNTSTGLFCDFLNNPFSDSNKRDAINVLFSSEFGTDGIYLAINTIINSSCVNIAIEIFGGDILPDLTNIVYVISPQPVFGVTDNNLVINGIRMFYETNESLDTFGVYTRQNTLQDKPGGNLFTDAFTNTDGELEYVFGTQTGLNNSGSFIRNSFGVWSTRLYNITQKEDINFLHNMIERWEEINIDPLLIYNSNVTGASLAVEFGVETQKVFFHNDLGNGEFIGEGQFGMILEDGEKFNVREGAVHISDESIKEFGFQLGANLTTFFEDFETVTLDKFTLITSGKALDEWAVNADLTGDCPTVSESLICIHAGPSGGSGDTIIQTNITTIDLSLNNLVFYINTLDMASGGDFEVTMNNNVGSGDVSIYSTVIDVLDQQIVTTIPASMDDQILVTMNFIFSSSHPNRADTWIDQVEINATTTTSSLQNVSVQEGRIEFGNEGCFISQEVINEDLNQEINITCDNINIVGDTTFVNVEEQDLNVTGSIELNGTSIFDWAGVINSPLFPDYFLLNGSSVMQADSNFGGFNITNIASGFFNFIGSSIDRITKGWFVDIDASGNITAQDRFFLGNGASIGYNTSCQMIFYNSTGGIMSTEGCI